MTRRKVFLLGAQGQLGTDVVKAFSDHEVLAPTHGELDISDAGQIGEALAASRPDIVVNTAAFHHTGQCESDPTTAFAVNALGPLNLARACSDLDVLLIHISTDYVFDGHKARPYVETDPVSPLNVYGLSKAAGEAAVANYCPRHYVIRTCGLYGVAPCRAKGHNFVTKMLEVGRRDGKATVVNDEFVTPTWTRNLARQVLRLGTSDEVPFGIVHASDNGECSWFDFAEAIFALSHTEVELRAASVRDFPSTIRRPHYSVLDNAVLDSASATEMLDWRDSLTQYLRATDGSA